MPGKPERSEKNVNCQNGIAGVGVTVITSVTVGVLGAGITLLGAAVGDGVWDCIGISVTVAGAWVFAGAGRVETGKQPWNTRLHTMTIPIKHRRGLVVIVIFLTIDHGEGLGLRCF